MVNHHFEHGMLIQLNQLTPHKFNIDTKKWPYLKGTTFYKPSFWISMLVFGGWKHLTNSWIHILVQSPGPWRSFNAWLISSLQVCLTPSLKYRRFNKGPKEFNGRFIQKSSKNQIWVYTIATMFVCLDNFIRLYTVLACGILSTLALPVNSRKGLHLDAFVRSSRTDCKSHRLSWHFGA